MKRVLFLMIILLAQISVFAQVKKVAILETVDKENQISYANKLILRASLSKAVTKTAGYEAYDRTDIDAIMSEHSFQRTGMVEEDQIKKLGEMTGADYILVTEVVVVDANNIFVTAKLLDVVTARTILTDNVMMGNTSDKIKSGCNILAKKLLENNDVTKVEDKKEKKTKKEPQTIEGPLLERHSKSDQRLFGLSEYSYGENQLDRKALSIFLQQNSPQAYRKYMRGQNSIAAGWTFFVVGIASAVTGSTFIAMSELVYWQKRCQYIEKLWEHNVNAYWKDYYGDFNKIVRGTSYPESVVTAMTPVERELYEGFEYYDNNYDLFFGLGIGLAAAGGTLTVVSIPLLAGGYGTRNNAYKTYNMVPNEKKNLSLNLQCGKSTVGLALNF